MNLYNLVDNSICLRIIWNIFMCAYMIPTIFHFIIVAMVQIGDTYHLPPCRYNVSVSNEVKLMEQSWLH